MNQPLLSVIIPTYRREEMLCHSIGDVLMQDYPNFEVLVVDQTDSHTPQTQIYLEELEASGKISWFRLNWASLPGARNYGINRSKGEIIVFIDDDVQLPAGFLAAHARNYLERENVGAVAGRVLDRATLAEKGEELTIEDLPPEVMDPALVWYHLNLVHTIKPQLVLTARGCNMSFRRDIFTKYGLKFDERFGGNAIREESDLCLRIGKIGLQIWYDPEAYLVHLGEETGGCHTISLRSVKYQIYFYHNHFWLAFKNLTASDIWRTLVSLFGYHVLPERPPYYKSGGFLKTSGRAVFYFLGLFKAIGTSIQSTWNDGQIYSKLDPKKLS